MDSDRRIALVLWPPAALCGLILLLIAATLVDEAAPALADIGPMRFLADRGWYPSASLYDLTPMLAGTILTALPAVVIAAALGLAAAIACCFYLPVPVVAGFLRLIELAAAVPSVVYGLWGLVTLVPILARLAPPGASVLAAALVLAVMILPTVVLLATSALRAVPAEHYIGARALGFGRWSAIVRIVVPAARHGLIGAVTLAAARAIGETMAVLMVAGNVARLPLSLFDPARTLSTNIALEIAYAMDTHRSALFVSGLLLVAAIAACIGVASLRPAASAND